MANALGEHPRLARAGPRLHKQRAVDVLDHRLLLRRKPRLEWRVHGLASAFFKPCAFPTILNSASIVFGKRRVGSLWAVMTWPRCFETLVLAAERASNAARSRPPADL